MVIEEKIIGTIIAEIIKSLFKIIKSKGLKNKNITDKLEFLLERHIREVANWSSTVHPFWSSQPSETNNTTIGLTLDTVPRQFSNPDKKTKKIKEDNLLKNHFNFLILGDPGAGKTTTIKRLAINLLTKSPKTKLDWLAYPIVIRLKDLVDHANLFCAIADSIGLSYSSKQIEKTIRVRDFDAEDKFKRTQNEPDTKTKIYKNEITTFIQYFIDNIRLEDFIYDLLNSTNALLLLDGLDEVSQDLRESLEKDISSTILNLTNSKIILTCRSGDYNRHIEGFNLVEICPLTSSQIEKISKILLKNSKNFFTELNNKPYHDLVDRPLFLAQLIMLFTKYNYLPEQPIEVYYRIIQLMLEEWDLQKPIRRISRYSGFNTHAKLNFLAELSFYLTYKTKTKIFRSRDLVAFYNEIYSKYKLPQKEAHEVAKEIESYTGIIFNNGTDRYEFSHLSLQEYLCGYHVSRFPYSKLINQYISDYPAPIAIAVACSSEPSDFFALMVLSDSGFLYTSENQIYNFLSRINIEKPYFSNSIYLGFAIISLLFTYGERIYPTIISMLENKNVSLSLGCAMNYYSVRGDYMSAKNVSLEMRISFENDFKYRIQEEGDIQSEIIRYLIKENIINPTVIGSTGPLLTEFELK